MEEEKIQRLHDSLSKLRKGKGLGTDSHFSWNANDAIPMKKDEEGKLYREDGLPVNGLYSNFVKQGSYDPTKQTSALKYGDGRAIKRNFDDIKPITESEDSAPKEKKSKEERKEEKKAAKLEAKKQAKLEEKRRLKVEAKLAKKGAKKSDEEEDTKEIATPAKEDKDKSKKKKSKKKESDIDDSESPKKVKRKLEDVPSSEKKAKKKKKDKKSKE